MSAQATTYLGFLFLTANSLAAIHRSHGEITETSFVVVSYLCLVLLFVFLRRFEAAPPNSPARGGAKAGVWVATTLLIAVFSWRVSAVTPWPVDAIVWVMAASTVLGGFYTLFLHHPGGD
ncbi:hypothetical protein OsI_09565 [Oryza sativa Indica Group]|jgi:di/tricarboxylate transporter|uniref:Uncharacterized protein n=1 Tax=Oryza sativa subsp. indica TaxID=39946 RepID=B8AFI5_ORYSI|nr:hypothetical protein OsI_09565 [Oryza sativa Indica Group]